VSAPQLPGPMATGEAATLRLMPALAASGDVQMAVDEALLDDALFVTARRYVWTPPALSLGKFQRLPEDKQCEDVPFDVVRRPSGGRAVLHGEGFEWSFAVVFPPGTLPGRRVEDAYEVVSAALAEALSAAGVRLGEAREAPYRSSKLCFASGLRHDLFAAAGKVAAVAQVRRGGAALVHGSVLERRPPDDLIDAVEQLLGEPWQGDGLAAADRGLVADRSFAAASHADSGAAVDRGACHGANTGPDAEAVWAGFVRGLAAALGLPAPLVGAAQRVGATPLADAAPDADSVAARR
jgi:lipoate-protein ligase A